MKAPLCVIAAAFGVAAWLAQEKPAGFSATQASELQWKKAEHLPAGVLVASSTPGAKLAVDFLKFPAGTRVPLHWHSANHVVTVVSGRLVIGAPGSPDKEVGPGGYFQIPGKTPHWTWAKEDCVFQVVGDAPNDLHWVKPD